MRSAPAQLALEHAFLQSVMYAAVFDYPLTLEQLRQSLIGETASEEDLAAVYAGSLELRAAIESRDGFYFPRGRREVIAIRADREAASHRLLTELAGPLALVTRMPFVSMVAVSGSLAHLNGEAQADLDLFVVTRPARVWSVTVTVLALAKLFGWRERLCLNYVVSERALIVSPADLFSANQIIHLRPVTGAAAYRRFLDANRFVDRFYPNFRQRDLPCCPERRFTLVERILDWTLAPLYERVCRVVYGLHLRRRAHTWRSRDQVRLEAECLKLHTASHRYEVMEKFEQAIASACVQDSRPARPA